MEEEILEGGLPPVIQADNLSIEHCTLGTAFEGKRNAQLREGFEFIPIARDKRATAILDECQGTESVPLDLEEPISVGEWLCSPHERHRLELHL